MAIPVRTRASVCTVTADSMGPVFVTKDGKGLCAILHVSTQVRASRLIIQFYTLIQIF